MARTQSRFRNANGNVNQCPVIEHAPEVTTAPEPITVVAVQAMIRDMMAEQREDMRQMFVDRDEPTLPIVQHELNIEQSR